VATGAGEVGMNLRVLIYLNPSVFDKVTHKFDLTKDSGFLMVKNSILAISQIRDYHFYLLVPSKDAWVDAPKNVTLVEYPYINDALNTRYHFDTVALHEKFSVYRQDIDLIWTMLPENVSNFRAWALKRRESIPIFTYCNWVNYQQSAEWPSYQYRLMEGLVDCDAFGIQSEHMKSFLVDYLVGKAGITTIDKIPFNKVHIISPKTIGKVFDCTPSSSSKIIGFPHRISQESYFNQMYELIKPYLGDCRIWVSNLSGTHIDNDGGIINKSYPNWDEYMEELRKIKFGISYHIGYSMWSMSVLDMMAVGKVVLAPNKNAFPEIFPEGYPFLFDGKKDFLDKFKQLMNTSEEMMECWGRKNQEQIRKKFTWSVHAMQLVDLWESLLTTKTHYKTAKIMDLLHEYNAISKYGILKQDVIEDYKGNINLAWSVTRQELMRDFGVKDDINCADTIFYLDKEKYKKEGLWNVPKNLVYNPYNDRNKDELEDYYEKPINSSHQCEMEL